HQHAVLQFWGCGRNPWRTFIPLIFGSSESPSPSRTLPVGKRSCRTAVEPFRMPNIPLLKPHAVPRPVWVSVADACFAGGFGRTRCYELIAQGLLISIKLGRKRLISLASIEGLGDAL